MRRAKATDVRIDLHDATGYLKDISCCAFSAFDPMTDDDLWQSHDTLVGTDGARRKQLEQAMGVTVNLHGLLADRDLRRFVSPSLIIWDYMHVYLSNGIAGWEIQKLLWALTTKWHATMEDVRTFFQADWKVHSAQETVARQKNAVRCLADDCRENWRGDAGITLYTAFVLEHFLDTVVHGDLQPESASFRAMCDCLRAAAVMKSCGCNAERASTLTEKCEKHLKCFTACYGEDEAKPKHHYALHLGAQFKDRAWLDCFVLERKHKMMKRRGTQAANLSTFEFTVLSSAVEDQLQALSELALHSAMVGKRVDASGSLGAGWQVARGVHSASFTASGGDLVWLSGALFRVDACCQCAGSSEVFLLATQMDAIRKFNAHATFRPRPACNLVSIEANRPCHASS